MDKKIDLEDWDWEECDHNWVKDYIGNNYCSICGEIKNKKIWGYNAYSTYSIRYTYSTYDD